jgi:hypothetical protein
MPGRILEKVSRIATPNLTPLLLNGLSSTLVLPEKCGGRLLPDYSRGGQTSRIALESL